MSIIYDKKIAGIFLPVIFFISVSTPLLAQNQNPLTAPAEIHGSFQIDGQFYIEDSAIGAPDVPEKYLLNGYGDLTFSKGNFKAGIRYETYQNVLLGYDKRYSGSGIAHRYAEYINDELDITVGNFYEQFGSGLIFRSYWEPTLGYDNALDGIRLKYKPYNGIYLKGIIGKQRVFFSQGEGIVRGGDAEVMINELCKMMSESKTRVTLGSSFVSKYQIDQDPVYILPENVAAFAGRFDITRGKFGLSTEYVYKYNDPSYINQYSYKFGDAALLKASYSQKGLGILLAVKRIDNMNFRSERDANLNDLLINYLPALTKYHTYSLATIYPYATQPNGEEGLQTEINYTIKKGTTLGGEYGTNVILNYSASNALDTKTVEGKDLYESNWSKIGKDVYYKDLSLEISRKISQIKMTLVYINQVYDKDKIQFQGSNQYGTIYSNMGVADITFKLTDTKALRTEFQALVTEQDNKSWASALIEFSKSPHWFVAAGDQYNYGNDDSKKRLHYYNFYIGYTKNANRIAIGYGKQREGLFCVGGVCRQVPASSGVTLSVSSSF